MILKAGTYKLNNTLVDFPIEQHDGTTIISGDIVYNDEHYPLFQATSINNLSAVVLGKEFDDENLLFLYKNGFIVDTPVYITFVHDIDCHDVIGAWFITNTNYNEVNAKPLAEITYNGETIAQLNTGETCTLKCAGLPMETDIIIKINEAK